MPEARGSIVLTNMSRIESENDLEEIVKNQMGKHLHVMD